MSEVYTYKDARQNSGSPLDVEGIDLGLTAEEIVAFVQEGRRIEHPAGKRQDR